MLSRTISILVAAMFLAAGVPAVLADYLADIKVSSESPAALPLNWIVEVGCDWEWTGITAQEEVEMSIKVIPMTNGSISPGAHIVDVQPSGPGSGRVWPWFTIQSGAVTVDEILLTMELGPPENVTLLEITLPVSLHFGPHAFFGLDFDFLYPERMQYGQYVNVDFIWETNYAGGHRVVIRPLTNGSYTPNLVTGGSPILTGTSGSVTRYFSVLQDEADFDEVDGIVFEIYNADWSVLLYEFTLPAYYRFGTTAVQNIVLSPDTPASLMHGENVTITFDYLTDYPMDPVMYAVPQTGGVHSPGYILNPAMPLPPGFGSGTNTFSIHAESGLVDVDEILFSLHDFFDEENIIDQFRMPVYFHYSGHSIRSVEYNPEPPGIFSNGSFVNLVITWENGQAEDGWVYNIPRSGGIDTPNLDGYFRSIAHPGPGSPKRHFFTVTAGDHLVDNMHFEMYNNAEDVLWLSYFLPTWFHFGPTAYLSPVIGMPSADLPVLHDCFPNPFNPLTTIRFDLPADMAAGMKVYDLRGRLVRKLAGRQVMTAGENKAVWDGKDDSGRTVAAGVYIYRLVAGDFSVAKRMTLVK